MVREPQGSRHAAGIRRVLAAFRHALGDAWQIAHSFPSRSATPPSRSPTSPYKGSLYARAGIPEYWLADLLP